MVAALLLCATARKAPAGVTLDFLDADGTSSGWLAARTATFTLTLNISSSEATTGLDYYLRSIDGNGFFSISARDTTNTAYPELINSNASIATLPASALNPQTDLDAG